MSNVKDNLKLWSSSDASISDFGKDIHFLIDKQMIKVPSNTTAATMAPSWFKRNANWWANEKIADDEFIRGLQWLIDKGIVIVK